MRSTTKIVATTTFCALAAAAAVALAAWFFSQTDDPTEPASRFRISGASMADVLRGEHFEFTCGDCQFVFACDASDLPHDNLAVCPNCGFRRNEIDAEKRRDGHLVNLSATSRDVATFDRWDVIAFTNPDHNQQENVKRIVGLPGEQITIRRGDIYVNDQIVCKSMTELKRVAVLVHDNRFRPKHTDSIKPRWRPELPASRWRAYGSGFLFESNEAPEKPRDWLVYHHWPCMPSLSRRAEPAPIKDNYGFNQGLARQLHWVTDLMLVCDLEPSDWIRFAIRLQNRYGEFQIEIARDARSALLTIDGDKIASCDLSQDDVQEISSVEFAICDARAILALNRVEKLNHPIGFPAKRVGVSESPLAIAATGIKLSIRNLRIFRDLHYLDEKGMNAEFVSERPAGKSEYFVLGDNVPISIDSRRWKNPFVSDKLIIGKVSVNKR